MSDSPGVSGLSPEAKRRLLERLLRERAAQSRPAYSLSRGQQALWFLYKLAPQSAAYNVACAVRLRGHLDVAALRRALQEVAQRHAVLRSRFEAGDDEPLQRTQGVGEPPFRESDAAVLDDAELLAEMSRACRVPFDLESGPVWRAELFRRSDSEHVFLLTLHHIVIDAWSAGLVLRELTALYAAHEAGRPSGLPAPSSDYATFVEWQRAMLQGSQGRDLLAYWERKLGGPLPVLNLPTDKPRPAVQRFRGASHTFSIEGDLVSRLRGLARSEGATLYMLTLAAFQTMLCRYTGQEDFLVGSPTAGRSRADFDGVVGYFVNPVVLRADCSGEPSFRIFLGRVRETVLEALKHTDYPFPLLVEHLKPERDPSRSPLFQVAFNLMNRSLLGDVMRWGSGVDVEPLLVPQQEGQFDLELDLADTGDLLFGSLRYDTDLFEPRTAERMAGHFRTLIEGIVESPGARISDLPLLTSEEESQLARWNATQKPYPSACVHHLIVEQAGRVPERVAAECGGARMTYGELEERSGHLAEHLRGLGVGPDVLVGIFMERSLDMLVGLLAVLRAGGAYVPLDPAYPRERLAYMLEDSGARVLLTQGALRDSLPVAGQTTVCVDGAWGGAASGPGTEARPESLAYVIYTSGSTGKPKGVAVTHRSLVNLLVSMAEEPGLTEQDVLLSVTTLSFDIAGLELYLPLLVGARVVLVEREDASDGRALRDRLAASGATVMQATPATWRLLVDAGWEGTPELKLLCGGEALPRDLANQLQRRAREVWNLYGPTETTIWSSVWRVIGEDGPVPIGRPIANTGLYVLDGRLKPLPVGVPGELFIGGHGLARGYWRRPELTAEKFLPDPFARAPGARMYRTGDLARHLPDAAIEYLGRLDHQVKVRGFRIELGEIESVLAEVEGVRQIVCVVKEAGPGDQRLVAYVTTKESASAGEKLFDTLKEKSRERLPSYMVPSLFVELDALPLTPNGKVDRRGLPAPEGSPEPAGAYAAPGTDVERGLASIWQEVLGVERVGLHDNFFDLGGHSLLATQVVSRARKALGVALSLRELFNAPTVAGLAARVEAQRAAPGALAAAPPLVAEPWDGPAELSYAQQRLWFLDQLEPGGSAYVIAGALGIGGGLDMGALERALAAIVARHESLRTTFTSLDGRPVQVVSAPGPWPLTLVDLSGEAEPRARVGELLREEAQRGFDLAHGPLFRPVLYRLDSESHVLLVCMHHIVSDGWSIGVIVQELGALYEACLRGEAPVLPELPIHYRDFARWQRAWLHGQVLEAQLEHWHSRLAGAPQVLELPTDRPRPAVESHRGAIFSFTLPRELADALRALSRREGVTLFATLLAGFSLLLSRYTGQEDLLVGSPVANRNRVEIEGLVGCFVNTLVLRANLSGDPTLHELLARVREECLQAFSHQDLPFEKLVEELRPERDLSRNPLFQVMLVLQNAPLEPLRLSGLRLSPVDVDRGAAQLDLTLHLQETPEGLRGIFEYAADLFEERTMARMAGHLQRLLEGMVSAPGARISDLPLLTSEEESQLARWNATQKPYPSACVHHLIVEQAGRVPERVAAECGGARMTYGELEERSGHLAEHLRGLGVGPDVLVGIFMERSLDMLVGLLAVLRAGGAYVPLDPAYPRERLAYMLEDSGARVLLTQGALRDSLPVAGQTTVCVDGAWGGAASGPGTEARPESLAYVIYTSGSTGKPKGVAVTHRSLVNLLVSMAEEPGLTEQDVLLSVTTLSFDIAGLELYLPLLVGARVVLVEREDASDGRALRDRLAASGATVMQATPATWRLLVDAGWEGTPELKLLCGGEALPRDLANQLQRRAREVWNLYGPTETTIWSSVWRVIGEDGPVPIGRPIANTGLYVLDGRLKPLPVGVPGELFIGGHGLARGYWRRPELTAEKFLPDPFARAPGARMYRTGDLARHLPDAAIEYLGRLDHQVKVRGFRIELGEIESVLAEVEGVRQIVCVVKEAGPGDQRLVAYVTTKESASAGEKLFDTLKEKSRERLPSYMVPSLFVELDALPLTPNGKVDRRGLPAPEGSPEPAGAYAAPGTDVERGLASIWQEVLGVERVGLHDNFFDLGGHSLLATQVVSRARKALGVALSLRELFNAPTVAGLAARVEAQRAAPGALAAAPPLVAEPWDGPAELSYAQQRLWFLDQLEPGGSAYVIAGALGIGGGLDMGALERALAAIVARHESLRTTFTSLDGRPVQVVSAPGPWPLTLVDLSGEAEPRARVGELLREEAQRGFDLAHGPLFRPVLYRLDSESHVLLVCMHHIVSDGWSIGVIVQELGALYEACLRGEAPVLPELPIHYRDFARWQRAWLQGQVLEAQLEHWHSRLAGAPQVLELPTDRPRPAVESHRGAIFSFTLPRELADALRALSRREGVTLFATLLAGFSLLLSRYTGQEDLLVGSPVANRNRVEIEGLVGCFVNTLVLRANLSGDPTLHELLARVREECLQAFSHQDLPFEKLVEELRPERDLSRNPLFQVMLVLQNAPLEPLRLSGLRLSPVDVDRGAAQLDLTLHLQETPEGLRGIFEYAADLFEERTMARMAGHLQRLLEGMVSAPGARISDLPLLTSEEESQLARWNATQKPYPSACVHHLIVEQAGRVPERVAAECGGARMTYGELEERSGHLAEHLRGLGVGPDVLVGIFMERSLDMLVGLLAVLRAGGAYVPLDPAYPRERLAYMLEDSGARVLLTQGALRDSLPVAGQTTVCVDGAWGGAASGPGTEARPESLAYVIYTSGSTGKPKGVAVTHRSLVNLLVSMAEEPGLTEQDVLLSVTTLSFDIAGLELYLPLLVGARVVLVEREDASDGRALRDRLAASGATVMQATPATWRLLVDAGWEGTPELKLLCGGEALPRDLANQLQRRAREVWNLYGPTETTIWSSVWRVIGEDGPVPIGRPIANTGLYVFDGRLKPLPVGVPGELFIGGHGLARGYWRRPELTAEKFLPDPFARAPGARMYRTGDLARHLPDAAIEYLGRLDHQVKVRGFRIELGEIEAVIAQHASVREVVVVAREDVPGDRRLVAYLSHSAQGQTDVTLLRNHLKALLPVYMIPASFVFLDRLPLTPNGKLDRRALDRLGQRGARGEGVYASPRTAAEVFVAEAWAELLDLERVDLRDNFFDLGGHSLLAMKFLARVEQKRGFRFNPGELVYQTLEQFAAAVDRRAAAPEPGPAPKERNGILKVLKEAVTRLRPRGSKNATGAK